MAAAWASDPQNVEFLVERDLHPLAEDPFEQPLQHASVGRPGALARGALRLLMVAEWSRGRESCRFESGECGPDVEELFLGADEPVRAVGLRLPQSARSGIRATQALWPPSARLSPVTSASRRARERRIASAFRSGTPVISYTRRRGASSHSNDSTTRVSCSPSGVRR